jgi:hypothetical protein
MVIYLNGKSAWINRENPDVAYRSIHNTGECIIFNRIVCIELVVADIMGLQMISNPFHLGLILLATVRTYYFVVLINICIEEAISFIKVCGVSSRK